MLPMIALIPHFISAFMALLSIVAPLGGYRRLLSWTLPLFLFVNVVLIAGAAFGFFGAAAFGRAIRDTVRNPLKATGASNPALKTRLP
jgi:hypothetical protein